MNFLQENNLLYRPDFKAKCAEVNAAFDEADATLKAAERKLSDMAALIKHVTNYQQTKPAANGLKVAKDKGAYRHTHESELIIHETTVRAIKATLPDGGKLPSLIALKAECTKLSESKDALRSEYNKLKKQAHEYGIIKRNMNSILHSDNSKNNIEERAADNPFDLA